MISFKDSGLSPEIVSAVEQLGFETLTPIQEKTIPALLERTSNLIALAQTGTGKTAAFGLPIIQQLDVNNKNTQALILSPTRELCLQIAKDLTNYSKNTAKIQITAVYGGASIEPQIRSLKKGSQIVVGTPGRTLDLIKRKILKIESINWMILDEADEMLSMGFKDDLDAILEKTPSEKQTLLFSATMPKEILRIAQTYMKNYEEISIGKKNTGAENVEHWYYMVHSKYRYEALKRIADINPNIYGIVFCRTRQETKDVADKLMKDGYNADALHGDLSQAQRDNVMNRFRIKHLQLLVATDVAARGIDVNDLTHIVNYNLPDDPEVYIHRSGRTGRAGKKGISISIIHTREKSKMKNIERIANKKFIKKMVPQGQEICEKQLFKLIDNMERVEVNEKNIDAFLPTIYKKLEWLSREDLIKRFVSIEFNRFLDYYKNSKDLNVTEKQRDQERKQRKKSDKKYARLFINLGDKQKLNPARLIGLINENTKNRDIRIGKIDIMKKFSFFEVENKYVNSIVNSMKRAKFDGVKVAVEISNPKNNNKNKRK